KVVEVVDEPVALEPVVAAAPVEVVQQDLSWLELELELSRQAADAANEIYSCLDLDEDVDMDIDPVPMDLDFPSTPSTLLYFGDDDMDVDDVLMDIDGAAPLENGGEVFASGTFSPDGACPMELDDPVPTYALGYSSSSATSASLVTAPSAKKVGKQPSYPAARAPLLGQRAAFPGTTVVSPLGVQLYVPNGMGPSKVNLNQRGPSRDNQIIASLSGRGRKGASGRR
ncbi:hypothetical protein JCM8208_000139, partial [Rhodotorula glutinis]